MTSVSWSTEEQLPLADLRPPAQLGAIASMDGSCQFTVWAPHAEHVQVRMVDQARIVELEPLVHGYHHAVVQNVAPGARYVYKLSDGKERADPASRSQPQGVFGPAEVFLPSTSQNAGWNGIDLKDYILYEVHVGTYTRSGTFAELTQHIGELQSLGITAIELMPVGQFSGARNWGYDGVFPFAVQNTYGGPRGLQQFVDSCHAEGLAVVLDVVYNHLGPEGNFLADFGPYFTDHYKTPWGQAINFDGPQSDNVVRFFVENALYWLDNFRIDALRLDAIHGIVDKNAQPFLSLLSAAVDDLAARTRRKIHLIAESDLNDASFVKPRAQGGIGLHAQWNDDFHHSLHSLQTGERSGYYQDFGSLRHLEKAFREGYVYTGEFSEFRQCRHGNCSNDIRRSQLVVYSQNHDQVGNRRLGERSSALISFEAQKLSAGTVALSPYIPLFFMGEEYGETAPFLYFTNHHDARLGKAVREGRRAEFPGFHADGDVPDPQSESTFLSSKLDHGLRKSPPHRTLLNFYRELLRLRRTVPGLSELDDCEVSVSSSDSDGFLCVQRSFKTHTLAILFNFGDKSVNCSEHFISGTWRRILDSSETKWMGPGTTMPELFAAPIQPKLDVQPKSLCVVEQVPQQESAGSSVEGGTGNLTTYSRI